MKQILKPEESKTIAKDFSELLSQNIDTIFIVELQLATPAIKAFFYNNINGLINPELNSITTQFIKDLKI